MPLEIVVISVECGGDHSLGGLDENSFCDLARV